MHIYHSLKHSRTVNRNNPFYSDYYLMTFHHMILLQRKPGVTTRAAVKIAYVASGFYPDGTVASWGLNSYRAVQLGVQHANKNKWAGKRYELQLPKDLVFQANGTNSTQLVEFIRYGLNMLHKRTKQVQNVFLYRTIDTNDT